LVDQLWIAKFKPTFIEGESKNKALLIQSFNTCLMKSLMMASREIQSS